MKKLFVLLLTFCTCFGLIFCENASKAHDSKQDKGKKKKDKRVAASSEVQILDKWDMPAVLKEVSGIAYLGPNRFACVQDEAGTIFIYNTATSQIEKQIPFGGSGDYEGITVTGESAYVVSSDGKLYEIADLEQDKPKVKTYVTSLTAEQNVEGLCYDKKQNRLLLAIKGSEINDPNFKGIYAFDLASKKLKSEPIYKIDLRDPTFASISSKKPNAHMQPSEINVHPVTGDIYLTEATKPKLLILDNSGKIKNLLILNTAEFSQPEGLTFSPTGDLFISNEGKKEAGNILKVKLP
ncbi:hypothetical protein AHMF7605_01655 [Adhaeribacter arboris]|uniref:SdiA-regulated family protein n=1 Tax=Adhaeribacter arboris TaxID=2072846 RepID=A0A2T2YA03_9BACT|nr:SdiA-regulated domain-containing protein [Adhaeribacter arboris]PSR52316.1 hypothetical protein AHMF7605_01655 [Adhaeribacter arboris]